MDISNPYAALATVQADRPVVQRRESPQLVPLAKLSWQLALGGVGLGILIGNLVGWPTGVALLFLFTGSGFVLAVICLCLSPRYRGLWGHAMIGLVSSALFAFLTLTMLAGWLLAYEQQDAARRAAAQQNLSDLKNALERYKAEHPEP